MMFHQVAAKNLLKGKFGSGFYVIARSMTQNHVKRDKTCKVVEMTSGYSWTTKSSQSIKEVCSGTYIHLYTHQRLA